MNTNYIEELNESQCAAVTYNDGPSLVIAGAGSGKTRVLTYKIAYLLENGYQPWNILALTFTNKAAREMKERIARQVGMERARYLWMGTFHSVFSRILRAEAQHIGFTSQFTIYDSADSKSLIRSIIKEMGLDEKTYKPGMVQARISSAKNHLVSPTGYAANKEAYEGDMAAKVPPISVARISSWGILCRNLCCHRPESVIAAFICHAIIYSLSLVCPIYLIPKLSEDMVTKDGAVVKLIRCNVLFLWV